MSGPGPGLLGGAPVRAVIFDLWDTLVDFDVAAGRAFQDRVAERLGRDPDEFAALWLEGRPVRESGTLRNYLLGIGVAEDLVDELVDWRRKSTRALLSPGPRTLEKLVGDGANDELAGAERVGMRAILIHRAGEDPLWDEVRDWRGPRITAIPQVLSLLDE